MDTVHTIDLLKQKLDCMGAKYNEDAEKQNTCLSASGSFADGVAELLELEYRVNAHTTELVSHVFIGLEDDADMLTMLLLANELNCRLPTCNVSYNEARLYVYYEYLIEGCDVPADEIQKYFKIHEELGRFVRDMQHERIQTPQAMSEKVHNMYFSKAYYEPFEELLLQVICRGI